MKDGDCVLLSINIYTYFTIVSIYVCNVHTVEIYLLRQKLRYNEAKCYSRHSFIIWHPYSHLIPTINTYLYTSVKLKICAARRTYKGSLLFPKKNVLQAKRKCGMFWNFPYIQSTPHIQKTMKSLLLMQYEELAVWNMRPAMPAAYALTI